MFSQKIKTDSLTLAGEIRVNEANEKYYYTERNCLKNQIFNQKTVFLSDDYKEFLQAENAIGISLNIVKDLLSKNVKFIVFFIMNFPNKGEHFYGKIEMIDLLNKGITIKENHFDKQRIVAMKELEIIKRY